jgi:hypothetical protein
MRTSASGVLGCAFAAIGTLRAPIVVSVVCAIALIVPEQTRELYRQLVLESGSNVAGISLGFLAMVLLSSSYFFAFQHVIRNTPSHREDCAQEYRRTLDVLIALLAASPFLAVAYGLHAARSSANCASAEQSCGARLGVQATLDTNLLAASIAAALVGCVCIAIVWGLSRRSPRGQPTQRTTNRLAYGVLVTALAVFAAISLTVAALPAAVLATLGVFCFFFLLATLLLLFASALSAISDSTGVPVVAVLIAALLALAFIPRNDRQTIRVAAQDSNLEFTFVGKAFVDWLSARQDLDEFIASGKPYPVYVVAANGGGAYAAYHAALSLARVQDSCPRFAQHLFAISGVSGGSLGGSVFAALATTNAKNESKLICHPKPDNSGYLQNATQVFFNNDLLTPLLAAGMFPDLLQRALPWRVPSFDRAQHFERAMEAAWARAVPKSPGVLGTTVAKLWSIDGATPALVLNTTEVRSGGVEVIAPFRFELDAYGSQTGLWLGTDIPLRVSTAIGMSARFPWVTPAAGLSLGDGKGQQSWQFVDGGYFENSGIETAHRLIVGLQSAIERGKKEQGREAHELLVPVGSGNRKARVAFRLLSLGTLDRVDTTSLFGELSTPLAALLNARFKRASLARFYARSSLCPKCRLGELSLGDTFREAVVDFRERALALGWILSRQSLDYVRAMLTANSECPISADMSYVVANAQNANSCFYAAIFQDLR